MSFLGNYQAGIGINGDTFSIKAPTECSKKFAAGLRGKFRTRGHVLRLFFLFLVSEKQTCTDLRATISHYLLPPVSLRGKTVDSYRRSCTNSRTSQRQGGLSGTGKRANSRFGKGRRRRHEMVTTIWCMFDSPLT